MSTIDDDPEKTPVDSPFAPERLSRAEAAEKMARAEEELRNTPFVADPSLFPAPRASQADWHTPIPKRDPVPMPSRPPPPVLTRAPDYPPDLPHERGTNPGGIASNAYVKRKVRNSALTVGGLAAVLQILSWLDNAWENHLDRAAQRALQMRLEVVEHQADAGVLP